MASAEEYANWIVNNADKKGTPEFETVARAYRIAKAPPVQAQEKIDPTTIGGTLQFGPWDTGVAIPNWLNNGLAGAGKAIHDMGQGVGQWVGAVDRKDVAESRKLDAPLMRTTAGKVGDIGMNMAMLAPTALIPGANTLGGAATIGAITGAMQPSTSGAETLINTGVGGAAGAALPLAQKAWAAGKAALDPLSAKGQDLIIGRALRGAAGTDADAVAQRLAEAAKPFVGPSQGIQRTTMGEFVPGSLPTVGQAAGNAGVASLERAATATNPNVTNLMSDTMKAQNGARVDLLTDMAGQGGKRDFFDAARNATAEQMYGAARRIGVDPAKLTPDVLANIANFSKRIPDSILNEARMLAKINGTEMTDATSVQGMHWIKQAIDSQIAANAGNKTMQSAYTGLKNDLLTGLEAMVPEYGAARQAYAAASKPINQMDVAQSIADQSINKLTGTLQPAAYARALSDKTAARATGLPSATLEGTLDSAQMNGLNSIMLDVQRAAAAQNAGRGVGSDTAQKLAYSNLLSEVGMPSLLRNAKPMQAMGGLLGRGADALYGGANTALSNKLAEVMLNPGRAADLMKNATPAERSAILELLGQGTQGLLTSAPASANALKQQSF